MLSFSNIGISIRKPDGRIVCRSDKGVYFEFKGFGSDFISVAGIEFDVTFSASLISVLIKVDFVSKYSPVSLNNKRIT